MLGFAFVLLMWPQPPSHPPCWSTALCLELCRTRNHSSGLAPRFSIAVEQSVTPDALCRSAPLPHRMPHPPSASPHAASSPLSPAGKVSSRALRLLSAAYTSLALRSAAALLGLDSPAALALRE